MTRTRFEESLSKRLTALADDAPTEPTRDLVAHSVERVQVQRRWLLPAAAAALVAFVGFGIWGLADGGTSAEVVTSPATQPTLAATDDAAQEAPDATAPCDRPALGGVRTDARNWNESPGGTSVTLTPTADCLLSDITVLISSGQAQPRAFDPTEHDPIPIKVRAGEPVTIEVSNAGGEACRLEPYPGWGAGWLQIELGDFLAESQRLYPTNPACEYSYTLDVGNVTVVAAYPSCSSLSSLVSEGERDYAGTRNTTFLNRSAQACRIDGVEVRGVTTEGASIDFTDYGDGAIPGIPTNVLPAVVGPGRGIAVLLVSHPTCLPPTTEITSTSIRVAGQVIELPAVPTDSCQGSYTVNLIEDAN